MYNTSAQYKLDIKKPSRAFECRITIGDKVFKNEDIVDVIIDSNIQPSDGFVIGSTTSTILDLTLLNKGDTIYSTNQIKVEIGLKIGNTIEYIPMGLYNIDNIEKTDYTTKFTAFDNMIKFETTYFSSLGDTPTLAQVVNELAGKTGVQFTGSLPSYTVKKLEGFTCREILGYVASLCGGNALITRDGKFTIVYPKDINYSIDANNYIDYKREEVKYKIGKVTCQTKEKETISKGSLGTDSMELLFENPWVTDSILQDIYNKLNGFEYLGYTMKWQCDLALDVGDIITCTDVKGVVRKLPILSQKLNYTGGLTSEIGAKGESKNKNSFSSSGSTANKVNRVVTEVALINKAFIDYAHMNNADIVNLKTETAKIKSAEIEIANINNLLAGSVSAGSTQTIHLTSANAVLDEALIKSGIAAKMSIGDLLAGNISTNKFRIVSDNGGIEIVGPTMQFKDKSNRVRIQMGQDATGNFNFILKGEDGTTTLIDHTGIKEKAIANDLIKGNMVAADAIGEKQINYNSLITGLNKDNNTQLIKASKVALDLTGQSLEVSFNSLKSSVDNIDGRNLLLNSGAELDFKYWIKQENNGEVSIEENNVYYGKKAFRIKQSSGAIYQTLRQNIKVKPGDKIAISGFIKVLQVINSSSVIKLSCNYYKSDGSIAGGLNVPNLNTVGEYKKVNFDLVIPNDVVTLQILLLVQGGEALFDNIKVEKDKYTDWTPAPEDIEQKIESNTTAINVVNEQIDTLVKETTITHNGDTVKLQDFYSTFKQTSKEINLKVESLETMEIGGRNILRNTDFIDTSYFTFSAGISLDKNFLCNGVNTAKYLITGLTSDAWRAAEPERQNVVEGRVYSASVETYIPTDNGLDYNVALEIQWFNASGARISQASVAIDKNILNKWRRIILENKVAPAGAVKGNARVRVQRNGKLWVAKLKLEEGTKATAWTVAPEDVDSSINGLSSRMATAEQKLEPGRITQSISDAINGGTASISTVTTTLDKTGFTVKNGAIKIQNKAGSNVLAGDTDGNLNMVGVITTFNDNMTKRQIELIKNGITFYDWETAENNIPIGRIYTGKQIVNGSTITTPALTINNTSASYMAISSDKGMLMHFDAYNRSTYSGNIPIWFYKNAIMGIGASMYFNMPGNKGEIYGSINDSLVISVPVKAKGNGFQVQSDSGSRLMGARAGYDYICYLNDTYIDGKFAVSGSKNSIQKTLNYGERLINAYETAEYFYGDLGSGKIVNGECVISIDEILLECVNTSHQYHVFTQVYNGTIKTIERFKDYFVVYGEEGTRFSWELKAKRLGYENHRLETPNDFDNRETYENMFNRHFEEFEAEKTTERQNIEGDMYTNDTVPGDILMNELDFRLDDFLLNEEEIA